MDELGDFPASLPEANNLNLRFVPHRTLEGAMRRSASVVVSLLVVCTGFAFVAHLV